MLVGDERANTKPLQINKQTKIGLFIILPTFIEEKYLDSCSRYKNIISWFLFQGYKMLHISGEVRVKQKQPLSVDNSKYFLHQQDWAMEEDLG